MDTLLPYDKELMFQGDLFSQKNNNLELGIEFILKSMTDKQREIIKLIATNQINNPEEKGVKQKKLMSLCVEAMICTSGKEIRDRLAEAIDHKLVAERTEEDGT